MRADWIDFGPVTYNAQTSYRGAIAYRFTPGFTTKLIGGRAFQTPSGTLLYAHGGFGSGANVQGTERLENPRGLDPQVVTSLELVIAAQVASFASVEASVFYQSLKDAIRFNEGGNLIVAKNSGSVETVGGELQVTLKFDRIKPYAAVSMSRQLDYELTRDLAGITSFSGSPSMFPRLFGYAGVDVDLLNETLFLNAELWWAGERGASQANFYRNDTRVYSLGSYKILDLTLSTADLPLLDRDLGTRLTATARNVLSEDYIEPGFSGVDIPQPDTSFMFELRQSL
jgi:outer membrane receptor protein involved in Fe transport